MPNLSKKRERAALRVANVIDNATPNHRNHADLAEAFMAVQAVAEYAVALAFDRCAKQGPGPGGEPSAEQLAHQIRKSQPRTSPGP